MKVNQLGYALLFSACIFSLNSFSQATQNISELNQERLNWYNLDLDADKTLGISVEKAYTELIPSLTVKQTVVVAVIDGGVDIEHPEFEGKVWVNGGEIPNNGIDDDGNGYIDDVNGWNFIGNADGENINYEQLEVTRIVASEDRSNPDYEKAYALWEKEYEKKKKSYENVLKFQKSFNNARAYITEKTGKEVNNLEDCQRITTYDPSVKRALDFVKDRYKKGLTNEELENYVEYLNERVNYFYNVDFDAREVIGDDINSVENQYYGNNQVIGPRASHGTSVAGVIAAKRGNNVGIDGIAENVKIMTLRVVPNGDERDKDVALAIRYAVDNGAQVVNMSFGKAFSPQQQLVEDAIKYAESNGVLLVHAAGNEGINVDVDAKYPTPVYKNGEVAKNYITIGASNSKKDKMLPAPFTNYGQNNVTLFSPGVDVISLDTTNTYGMSSGTSIASPMVSAVAATVWSYYPDLSVTQLIEVLKKSTYVVEKPKKVMVPNKGAKSKTKAKFSTLSQTGGVVNLYNALQIASTY